MHDTASSVVARPVRDWVELCERHITAGYVPTGGKAAVWASGQAAWREVSKLLSVGDGDVVVDVGCGNGRIAMALTNLPLRYIGFDIIPGCIEFCQRAFRPWPNFEFTLVPATNGWYYAQHPHPASMVRWPVADEAADVVLALSVFTHLGRPEHARHYLAEARRVLRPGGRLLATWFKSPPDEVNYYERRTVYPEADVRAWLSELVTVELETSASANGEWGGQWVTVCRR